MECARTLMTRMFTPILTVMTLLAGMALVGMLLVAGGDIVGRTLFDLPIEGSSNIISDLLFPACVFFSLPYLASRADHIRVDYADKWFPSLKKPLAVLFAVLAASFWGVIAWQAGGRAIEALVLNQQPIGAFGIPAAWSYGVVALGTGVAALTHLVWMCEQSAPTGH